MTDAFYEKHLREEFLPRREKLLTIARRMAELSEGKLQLRDVPYDKRHTLDPDKAYILAEPNGRIWSQFYVEEFVTMATALTWPHALLMFAEEVMRYKQDFPAHANEVCTEFWAMAEPELGTKLGDKTAELKQQLLG